MYVSDFYEDVKEVLGNCDQARAFRRLSEAIKLLSDKSQWDALIGDVDVCVCDGCVTLPRFVDVALSVNVGSFPTLFRDSWYQYHINGSGSQCDTPCGYTDDRFDVTTFRDPDIASQLVAVVEDSSDNNKSIRVFGWDANGKRIFTEGPDGTMQDGFLVPTIFGFPLPNPNAPAVERIDRIKKDVTRGFVKLIAIDPSDTTKQVLIGYYEPDETEPRYRRIRVQADKWVRIRYRKKNYEIRTLNDWINIDNRLALIAALKAVKHIHDDRPDLALIAEQNAVKLMTDEQMARNPPKMSGPQINNQEYKDSADTLFFLP